MARPVLHRLSTVAALSAVALTLAGCGVNESDPHRFEALAQSVASIPVSSGDEAAAPGAAPRRAERKTSPLKVELLTPHELWDVRDGGKARVTLAATPAPYADPEAPPTAAAPARPASLRHVQLGAFSSEDSARAAWSRLSRGAGGAVLSGLQPAYETVEVGGRRLIRLKVAASGEQAQALCRDLAASDPWCARSGGAPA
ncbi:SPOR domain-containing protein [Brevundimonas diminuta]|uniref:SPOR domain-containing protein n=1 Tax=Brevundimonas diminuta TaxID=293 RepID=UPI003209A298